jgi:hypothetical protein
MTNLSPAAEAVLNAANAAYDDAATVAQGTAAALRAAADQVVPQCSQPSYADDFAHGAWFTRDDVRDDLLRIAAELENFND